MVPQEWCNGLGVTGMVQRDWRRKTGATGLVPQDWCHRIGATELAPQERCNGAIGTLFAMPLYEAFGSTSRAYWGRCDPMATRL